MNRSVQYSIPRGVESIEDNLSCSSTSPPEMRECVLIFQCLVNIHRIYYTYQTC